MNVNKALIREIGIGITSAGLATGITYVLTKKHFQKYADEQIESVKETYKALRKEDEYATPESAVEHLRELREEKAEVLSELQKYDNYLSDEGYVQVPDPTPEDLEDNGMNVAEPAPVIGTPVHRYTVTDHLPDPDEDLPPIDEPDDVKPYLIRVGEWHEEYDKHAKISITYYAEDGKLADETDTPINDIGNTVGVQNLTRFGEGSEDDDLLYVRNSRLNIDYEITRDPRSFYQGVYGVDEQHMAHVQRNLRDDE